MKGVVDLFVAKDRTAILWFLIACVSIALSAAYVKTMVAEVRSKPQFVIMAMETIFNRNPSGLDNDNRRPRLFVGQANDSIDQELAKESAIFRDEEFHQKVEVDDIQVLRTTGEGEALTSAKGQLIRIGKFKGKPINETWEVEAKFVWALNKGFGRRNAFFPTVCRQIQVKITKSSS